LDNQVIKELKDKIKFLKKKEQDLIISDLDDTIFSTNEIIKRNYRKWKRGDEWNKYLLENNLIDTIIKEIYTNKIYPTTISSKLRKNNDLILTAGIKQFQIKKVKALKLEYINIKVVNNWEDKILETIKYVINILWFIPNKITIYEDRPNFFVKYKEFIENFLWTKLEIMFVEMTWNNQTPKILEIK